MHQPVPAIFLSLAPPSTSMVSMLVTSAAAKYVKAGPSVPQQSPVPPYSNGIVETGATEEQRYGESSGSWTRRGHKIMLGMCWRWVNRSEQGKRRQMPATGKRNHRGLPEREPLCFVKGAEASGEKHCGTSTKWAYSSSLSSHTGVLHTAWWAWGCVGPYRPHPSPLPPVLKCASI